VLHLLGNGGICEVSRVFGLIDAAEIELGVRTRKLERKYGLVHEYGLTVCLCSTADWKGVHLYSEMDSKAMPMRPPAGKFSGEKWCSQRGMLP
jgi:hypothetical protein